MLLIEFLTYFYKVRILNQQELR